MRRHIVTFCLDNPSSKMRIVRRKWVSVSQPRAIGTVSDLCQPREHVVGVAKL